MMNDVQTRRDFLKRSTVAGGFCCAFFCANRLLSARNGTHTEKGEAA